MVRTLARRLDPEPGNDGSSASFRLWRLWLPRWFSAAPARLPKRWLRPPSSRLPREQPRAPAQRRDPRQAPRERPAPRLARLPAPPHLPAQLPALEPPLAPRTLELPSFAGLEPRL